MSDPSPLPQPTLSLLVPRLRTTPTHTRARSAPRPCHNLHRVHLGYGRRLAPTRIGRRGRRRRRFARGRRRSTPWLGIRTPAPPSRGWSNGGHNGRFHAIRLVALAVALLHRTWRLDTHARAPAPPLRCRCWCRCRGSGGQHLRLGLCVCARLAFAFVLRAQRADATCDLRDAGVPRTFGAAILVVGLGFDRGWTCALGAATRAGACACTCSWDPRADVVAV